MTGVLKLSRSIYGLSSPHMFSTMYMCLSFRCIKLSIARGVARKNFCGWPGGVIGLFASLQPFFRNSRAYFFLAFCFFLLVATSLPFPCMIEPRGGGGEGVNHISLQTHFINFFQPISLGLVLCMYINLLYT